MLHWFCLRKYISQWYVFKFEICLLFFLAKHYNKVQDNISELAGFYLISNEVEAVMK